MSRSIMTVDQIRVLVSTALEDVFETRGKKLQNFYKKVLKRFTTPHAQLITMNMAGFGKVPKRRELEPYFYDAMVLGDTRTTTAEPYGMGFKISKETLIALSKDPYGEFSTAKIGSYKNVTEKMRDSIEQTKEGIGLGFFLYGHTTTQNDIWTGAGRDGVALFGTHLTLREPQVSTLNNVTGESLSQSSVRKMITAIQLQPSDEGFKRGYSGKYTLLHGPDLAPRAYEVLNTQKLVDTANHNVSVLNPFSIDPLTNPHIPVGDISYVLLDDDHKVGYMDPVAPEFESEFDFDTKGQKYSCYFQFGHDFLDWRGTARNAGS